MVGQWGSPDLQECLWQLLWTFLIVVETIVRGGGCLFSTACDCFALFCMDPTFKHVFVYNAETPGTYVDLTFFSFLPPPSVFISAPRFATTQTAKTWTAKAPFICVSHVTRAVIQRTRTTCTLTGTLDLTYSLKVDSLFCLYLVFFPLTMMSYPLPPSLC